VRAIAVPTDVSKADSVAALADRAYAEFGRVDVLCNNAGVVRFTPIAKLTLADYQWVMGVNFWGVVHGLLAFLPRMLAQEGERHIVNTSSIGGLIPSTTNVAAYTASKYAVAGLTETLRSELAGTGIGVSLLCPGLVHTRLGDAGRNRPAEYGGPIPLADSVRTNPGSSLNTGVDPEDVGRMVLAAMRNGDLYIHTGPDITGRRQRIVERFEEILAAYEPLIAAGET
jgi:NAD(P)-dependent dehydrogenase (short-subunit alcohol dehydrogenase family)